MQTITSLARIPLKEEAGFECACKRRLLLGILLVMASEALRFMVIPGHGVFILYTTIIFSKQRPSFSSSLVRVLKATILEGHELVFIVNNC
jgi:hypothetical protein